MEAVIQQGRKGWLKKPGVYGFAAIICPLLAAAGCYFERLYFYASFRRSLDPNCSISDAIRAGAERVGDNFGEMVLVVGVGAIIGLGLAAISAYMKRGLTITGLLALVINGFSFLVFVCVFLGALALKPTIIQK